jgi:hypothetical protein
MTYALFGATGAVGKALAVELAVGASDVVNRVVMDWLEDAFIPIKGPTTPEPREQFSYS